jgi:ribonuclease HIII
VEKYSHISAIGSDEVGTGDYFGPIVVCATYVSSDNIEKLKAIGVKDSKLLTDKQMIPLALKIAEIIPYSIVYLEPSRLNNLDNKYTNLNFIKAYLHNKAINSILKKCENVNGQKNVIENVTLIPKGEKVHIAIAAASVLARVAFLRELGKLSNEYDIDILKGAGPEVDRCAISFVKSNGWDSLKNVAKLKFANTSKIIEYFENNPLPKSRIGNFVCDSTKLKQSK